MNKDFDRLDDELKSVADLLQQHKPPASNLPKGFQSALRGHLMNEYQQKSTGWIWQWLNTAVSLTILVFIVAAGWFLFLQQNNAATGGGTELEIGRSEKDEPANNLPLANPIVLLNSKVDGHIYMPGDTVLVYLTWQINESVAFVPTAFLRLQDEVGVVAAQVDWLPGELTSQLATGQVEGFSEVYAFVLPAELPSATYQLVAGMYDPQTGQRLSIVPVAKGNADNTVLISEVVVAETAVSAQSIITPTLESMGQDTIMVYYVSPASGSRFTGQQPLTMTVRLFYDLTTAQEAVLTVKLVQQVDGVGRGVGQETAVIQEGEGYLTLKIPINPAQELNRPAYLELLVQMQVDEQSAPFFMNFPMGYVWSYEP